MKLQTLASLALDNFEVMCYVVDIDSYELLYVNEAARLTFVPSTPRFIPGQTCYQFLHGKDAVCDICNNHLLQEGQRLCTEIQNEKNKKYYSHIDSILMHEGRRLKLTFAFDTSRQKEDIESLTRIISKEETLLKCIHTLMEDKDLDKAVMHLLSIVCQYYDADRAYLFEISSKDRSAKNIYEWCVHPNFSSIDCVPILSEEELQPLYEAFEHAGEFIVSDVEALDADSALYKVLHDTSCKSVQVVPIYYNDEVTYFMGVDNARRGSQDLTLLHSIIIFVAESIKKARTLRQLEQLSYVDVLTGLDNRNKYLEVLENIDTSCLKSLGYVHVNINALKKLNDLYGELYGDTVLKKVAKLLTKHIQGKIFRISGDEFIALCADLPQEEFEQSIVAVRHEEQSIKEFSFAVGAVWQDKKIHIRHGLTQASDIMFSEKQNYYKLQATDKTQSRSNPVEIILHEIRSQAFTVYLQPKVNFVTGKISSAEALVRKFGTNGKMVSPDRFVPIYENEGTIRYLDFFVLEEVCKFLSQCLDRGPALPIAVNFSRVTCIANDVIEEIVQTCAKYSVPHRYVKIELTESMDKMDFDFFHKKIAQLKDLGFDISLDDFGAKHSNLLMLTMAEFSEVKIDKGLIDNITVSAENRTVVRNIIKTVKELGKSSCVGEGIETPDQVALLKDFGCTYGQGYFFHRPMPMEQFLKVVENDVTNKISETKVIGQSTRKNFIVNYDELYSVIDAMPLCMNLWSHKRENVMCNDYAVNLFGVQDKDAYLEHFFKLSPQKQPDGRNSGDAAFAYINQARNDGSVRFNWMHCTLEGEEIPAEITLVRLDVKSEDGDFLVAGYTRDLRPQLAGTDEAHWASTYFFNEVSDKTLFNTISEIANEFFWVYSNRIKKIQFFGKGRDILCLPAHKMAFPQRIVDRRIITDKYLEEFMKFSKAMEDGQYYPVEVEFNLPNGDVRYFRIDYKIIFDENNTPLFCIGKTSDIHDRKKWEKLASNMLKK